VRWDGGAKGKKTRRVPIAPKLAAAIKRYEARHRPEVTYGELLISRHRRPYRRCGIDAMMDRLKRRVGLHVHTPPSGTPSPPVATKLGWNLEPPARPWAMPTTRSSSAAYAWPPTATSAPAATGWSSSSRTRRGLVVAMLEATLHPRAGPARDGVALGAPPKPPLIGVLAGTDLALAAALGPLLRATTITVDVETRVEEAYGLPDARTLPASLEGMGAVALAFLLTRRPTGRLRLWCGPDLRQPGRRHGCPGDACGLVRARLHRGAALAGAAAGQLRAPALGGGGVARPALHPGPAPTLTLGRPSSRRRGRIRPCREVGDRRGHGRSAVITRARPGAR
jgi:hypothetical protein